MRINNYVYPKSDAANPFNVLRSCFPSSHSSRLQTGLVSLHPLTAHSNYAHAMLINLPVGHLLHNAMKRDVANNQLLMVCALLCSIDLCGCTMVRNERVICDEYDTKAV